MTEGAKTGTARMSDEWVADGNASHQDIMNLRDALTEALKVAGEALEWAQIELGKHTRPSPIDHALAALERIRKP